MEFSLCTTSKLLSNVSLAASIAPNHQFCARRKSTGTIFLHARLFIGIYELRDEQPMATNDSM